MEIAAASPSAARLATPAPESDTARGAAPADKARGGMPADSARGGMPADTARGAAPDDKAAREAARAFEAAYLAEMLKHSGLNANPAGFGGGAGEDAFGSFLTTEYARLIAERGGIGLAEHVFGALKAAEGRR